MDYNSINFSQKFKLFSERWQPKVICEMNDYQFKIARIKDEFICIDAVMLFSSLAFELSTIC